MTNYKDAAQAPSIEEVATRILADELSERLRRRKPVHLNPAAADVIREVRERD